MRKYFFYIIFFLFAISVYPQGSILLVGGGSENYNDWSDKPYKWLVEHAPNRKIIVLHYETTTTFFTSYFPSLSQCTVSNLAINSVEQANSQDTYNFILQHDGIFLRGGDQALYVSKWKNTLTEQAIKEVFKRGGVVGGTSAGEMVLSSVSYTAGNSDNGAILRSPASSITLEDNFLSFVQNSLAESHTNERGRLGRLPVFLARYKELKGKEITGIAVDVNSAIAIDKNGIGEVMGGSAVSILRWNPDTKFAIEVGRSFSMQNMKFDQLLPGWKINFNSGEIVKVSSASEFIPKQISSSNGAIILDGSQNPSDWAAGAGSLKKLQSLLKNSTDIIGIISSPLSSATSNTISTTLNSFGVNTQQLFVHDKNKNDFQFASNISLCGAFIFAGNSIDSLALFFNIENLAGKTLNIKIAEEKPILFLGDDVMMAGEKALGGIYSSQYSAYYGLLTQVRGLNLIKGIHFVPRLYQNQNNSRGYDYTENRINGMFWSMAKSMLPYGMLIDAGSYIIFSNGKFFVEGVTSVSTPVLMVDARKAKLIDFPTFRRPGRPNTVQNAALIGASLNIIRPGDSNLLTGIKSTSSTIPSAFSLLQNFPNPFNPTTTISYTVKEPGTISLKIYDSIGREVETLFSKNSGIGNYKVVWNAKHNSSGVYYARLDQISKTENKCQTIKLVLIK